ncbi:LysM peptidoglycan-binding domain-containing protein [Simkania negevensis]|uniref:LysM peptidoglycan-binding domain-containing protein n=1 Tax=Simkania negevensis TaxID=83561 RepID=A0ABS3ATX1_9BACT|nr:LysM peptidoglycan-binding domain-containing protein [Simkania negevensis]
MGNKKEFEKKAVPSERRGRLTTVTLAVVVIAIAAIFGFQWYLDKAKSISDNDSVEKHVSTTNLLSSLQEQNDDYLETIVKLKKSLEEKEADIGQVVERYEETLNLSGMSGDQQQQLFDMAAALTEQETLIGELKRIQGTLQEELTLSQDELTALRNTLDAQNALLESVTQRSDGKEKGVVAQKMEKQEEEIVLLMSAKTFLKESLEQAVRERNDVLKEYNKLKQFYTERVTKLNTALASGEQQLTFLKKNVATLEKAKGQQTASLKEAKQEIASLRTEVVQYRDYKERYGQEKELREQSQGKLQQLAKNLEEQRNTLNAIQASRKELLTQMAELYNEKQGMHSSPSPLPSPSLRTSLSIPPSLTKDRELPALQRTHVVQPGETLSAISQVYYGTPKKWQDIYQANINKLSSQHAIRTGMSLIIPTL